MHSMYSISNLYICEQNIIQVATTNKMLLGRLFTVLGGDGWEHVLHKDGVDVYRYVHIHVKVRYWCIYMYSCNYCCIYIHVSVYIHIKVHYCCIYIHLYTLLLHIYALLLHFCCGVVVTLLRQI